METAKTGQPKFERYAIFQTGGKQYQAIEGKTVAIEKLNATVGAKVSFDEVLLRKEREGAVEVGQPYLEKAITAIVLKHDREAKKIVFKFKRRKKYQVKQGHRQPFTVVRIESI